MHCFVQTTLPKHSLIIGAASRPRRQLVRLSWIRHIGKLRWRLESQGSTALFELHPYFCHPRSTSKSSLVIYYILIYSFARSSMPINAVAYQAYPMIAFRGYSECHTHISDAVYVRYLLDVQFLHTRNMLEDTPASNIVKSHANVPCASPVCSTLSCVTLVQISALL